MARKPIEEKDTDPNHPFYEEDDGFGGILDNLAPKETPFLILGSGDLIPGSNGVRAMAVMPHVVSPREGETEQDAAERWSRGAQKMLAAQTKIVLEDKNEDSLGLRAKRGLYARGD